MPGCMPGALLAPLHILCRPVTHLSNTATSALSYFICDTIYGGLLVIIFNDIVPFPFLCLADLCFRMLQPTARFCISNKQKTCRILANEQNLQKCNGLLGVVLRGGYRIMQLKIKAIRYFYSTRLTFFLSQYETLPKKTRLSTFSFEAKRLSCQTL